MPSVTAPTAEFADLTRALFGDGVDVDALWGEVSKMSPDPSSVHVPGVRPTGRKRRVAKKDVNEEPSALKRNIALATNAGGAIAAPAALGMAVRSARRNEGGMSREVGRQIAARRPGGRVARVVRTLDNKVGRAGKIGAAAAGGTMVTLQAANGVGDYIAAGEMNRQRKLANAKKEAASKRDVPLKALVKGRLTGLRRQSQVALRPTDPIMAGAQRGTQARRARQAQQPFEQRMAGQQRVAAAKPKDATPKAPPTPMPASTRTPLAERAAERFAARTPAPPVTVNRQARPPAPARTPVTPATQAAGTASTPPATAAAISDGKRARAGIDQVLGTTTGKVALVGTGALAYGQGRKGGKNAAYRSMDPYAKAASIGDVEFGGSFSKFDDDKRLAFGWASVVKVNGEPVVDRQGDYISIDDIEEAAYVYVEKSRVGGDMHRRAAGNLGSELGKSEDQPHKVGELVESMVFTPEKIEKMGLPRDFPVGWWVGYKIHDDEAWAEVKKGNRTGFSIHGKGLRREVDYDSILEAA